MVYFLKRIMHLSGINRSVSDICSSPSGKGEDIRMAAVNREHKDRLFTFLFGEKGNKEWTLSLYNAVNNTQYTDPDSIEFTAMEDAVYMGMKNDISFILCHMMNVYEQQSTYNPNMPEDFEIREFLIGHKAEVKDMCITEYNEAGTLQMIREESREEGDLIRAKKQPAIC